MPMRPMAPFVSILTRLVLNIILATSAMIQGMAFVTEPSHIYDLEDPGRWGLTILAAGMLIAGGAVSLRMWLVSLGAGIGGFWYMSLTVLLAFEANDGKQGWPIVIGSFTLCLAYLVTAIISMPPVTGWEPHEDVLLMDTAEKAEDDDDG